MDTTFHAVNDLDKAADIDLHVNKYLPFTQVSIIPLTAAGVPITDGSATGSVKVSARAIDNPLAITDLEVTVDLATNKLVKFDAFLEAVTTVPTSVSSDKYRVVVTQR